MVDAINLEAWDRFSDVASSGASSYDSTGRSETPSVAESVVSLETIWAKVDEIQKKRASLGLPNERALSSSLRGLAIFVASHAAKAIIWHSKAGLQASSRQRSRRMQASPFVTRL